MKIKIDRDRLLWGLQLVQGAVDKRQAIPVLGHILFSISGEVLTLTASDLEIEVSVGMSVDSEWEGATTLPARKLLEIVRALSAGGVVDLEVGEGVGIVRSGRSRFRLACLGPADFPLAAEGEKVAGVVTDAAVLRSMLGRVHFAMAVQDVRYYLNGMLMERRGEALRGVATDGHRLALCELLEWKGEWPEGHQALIPRKAVLEAARALGEVEGEVSLAVGEQSLVLRAGSIKLVSKLVDGRFPEYERVLPEMENCERRVIAEREELKQALQRVGILANEKYRAVRLTLGEDSIGVQAHNPEQEEAEEEVAAEVVGGGLEVGFNVGYMVEALNAMSAERVAMHLVDGNSSCLLVGVGAGDCRYVVMPMRL